MRILFVMDRPSIAAAFRPRERRARGRRARSSHGRLRAPRPPLPGAASPPITGFDYLVFVVEWVPDDERAANAAISRPFRATAAPFSMRTACTTDRLELTATTGTAGAGPACRVAGAHYERCPTASCSRPSRARARAVHRPAFLRVDPGRRVCGRRSGPKRYDLLQSATTGGVGGRSAELLPAVERVRHRLGEIGSWAPGGTCRRRRPSSRGGGGLRCRRSRAVAAYSALRCGRPCRIRRSSR